VEDENDQGDNSALSDLGRYTSATPKGHLRLHDVGELLRREGRRQGFVPVTELKVGPVRDSKHSSKVDWAWRQGVDGPIVAAFEIEGRDASYKSAGRDSLINDHVKLSKLPTAAKWLILFQVDHHLEPKDGKGAFDYRAAATRILDEVGPHEIRVLIDEDLWNVNLRAKLAAKPSANSAPPS